MKKIVNSIVIDKNSSSESKLISSVFIASAGEYGGVATHLNHFYSILSSLVNIKRVFLFAPDSPVLSKRDISQPLSLHKNLNSGLSFNIFSRFFPVISNLLNEIIFSFVHRKELSTSRIIISSHNPYGYWGFGLFAKNIDYYIFVLPEQYGDKRNGFKISSVSKIIDMRLFKLFIWIFKKVKSMRYFVQTEAGATIWEKVIGISEKNMEILPNPPFIVYENFSLISDLQSNVNETNFIISKVLNGNRLVLSIGHLDEYKNPRVWLDCALKATAVDSNYIFVWVGDGPMYDEIQRLVKKNKNIFLLGRLNQNNIRELYENSWLFFHPALQETQGIVIFDALAFGIPVFLNRTKILGTLLNNTETGFTADLSKSTTADEFVNTIAVLKEPRVWKHYSDEARKSFGGQRLYTEWVARLTNYYST